MSLAGRDLPCLPYLSVASPAFPRMLAKNFKKTKGRQSCSAICYTIYLNTPELGVGPGKKPKAQIRAQRKK